jgi:hypothetical protein
MMTLKGAYSEELPAGVRVSKGSDTQAVGGVQLPFKELAANILKSNSKIRGKRRVFSMSSIAHPQYLGSWNRQPWYK